MTYKADLADDVRGIRSRDHVTLYGIDALGNPWEISGVASCTQWGVRVGPHWAMQNNTLASDLADLVVTQRYVAPVQTFELTRIAIDAGMEVEPR
jgi:hypothetical protein